MWTAPFAENKEPGELVRGETYCLEIRGKIGGSTGLGNYAAGAAAAGDDNGFGGIYQRRHFKKKDSRFPHLSAAPPAFVLMRTYAPTNPRTVAQQANRSKMADCIAAWQALTDSQKADYNQVAAKQSKRGTDLFRSEYLLSH